MKKYPIYLILSLLLPSVFFGSCGEDRSGEYYALIAAKTWIYETMQQNYLFYADLPAEEDIDFFQKPQEFLSSVISDKDKKGSVTFSHIDSVNRKPRVTTTFPSFGLEGTMIRLDDGTNAVRILYVQDQSPAKEAGLKRGNCIIAVDSQKITTSNYSEYFQYPTQPYRYMLITPHIATKEEEEDKQVYDTCEVQLPAPRIVEQPSVFMTKNITAGGGRKAFYIMYNSFEKEDEDLLKKAFEEGMSASPNDVILDLRYNPGGYVSTSILLSSMLAPASAIGQPCLKLIYNDKINKEESIPFQQVTNYTYDNLYVITSRNTASASEIVINCLRPYLGDKLIQVGEPTFGKNVAQELFTTPEYPELEFWLTTAYLSNSQGEYNYFEKGLVPAHNVSESPEDFKGLGELGTPQDTLLYSVMYHMEHHTFPEPPQPEKPEGKKKVIYNPIADKVKYCKLP